MVVNNVTTNAKMAYSSATLSTKNAVQGAASGQDAAGATGNSAAYDVSLSAAGQQASKGKGLTADMVRQMQSQTDQSYALMIRSMTEQNAKVQGLFDKGIYSLSFGGTKIGIESLMLPAVGTTPEEARAAISEGGAYSVGAVSDRIFGLASAIAGGDPDKLAEMRAAVEKGFRQAGMVFKNITGQDDMPQITHDTYAEIMSRFDKRAEELGA